MTVSEPMQVPVEHVSVCVHALPSSHVVPFALAACTQPVPGLQLSSVHVLLSSQLSRQLVAAGQGKGSPAGPENEIHPAFADQARPLKIPVVRLITTPAPVGAKLIHPAFADHA